jgi:hypothetical protein
MTLPSLRSMAKRLTPTSILRFRTERKWAKIRERYGELSVVEAFRKTYSNRLWGDIEGEEFFSGGGSLDNYTTQYIDWLSDFIGNREIRTVIDLGCGDFRVGRRICSAVRVDYIASI